jgi:hypothetical protein
MKRTLLTMVVALAAALIGAPSAAAGDTKCVGSLSATYDNIIVPAAANCELIGARVRGNVLVRTGARLAIASGAGGLGNPTIVEGNVQAENARRVSIVGGQVRGNVQLKGVSEEVLFFVASVGGNVQVEGLAGKLDINITDIAGGLEVTKSSGEIDLGPALSVAGGIKLADNGGAGGGADRARGGGIIGFRVRTGFDFDASSGPRGENPTGTLHWSVAALFPIEEFTVQVTCLQVRGKRAWLGGTVTAVVRPGFPAWEVGSGFAITVEDNLGPYPFQDLISPATRLAAGPAANTPACGSVFPPTEPVSGDIFVLDGDDD